MQNHNSHYDGALPPVEKMPACFEKQNGHILVTICDRVLLGTQSWVSSDWLGESSNAPSSTDNKGEVLS